MEPGLGARRPLSPRRFAGGERDVREMRVLGALCALGHRVSYEEKRISSSRWYGISVAYSLAPYLSVIQSKGIEAKLDAHWGWLESRLGCIRPRPERIYPLPSASLPHRCIIQHRRKKQTQGRRWTRERENTGAHSRAGRRIWQKRGAARAGGRVWESGNGQWGAAKGAHGPRRRGRRVVRSLRRGL